MSTCLFCFVVSNFSPRNSTKYMILSNDPGLVPGPDPGANLGPGPGSSFDPGPDVGPQVPV